MGAVSKGSKEGRDVARSGVVLGQLRVGIPTPGGEGVSVEAVEAVLVEAVVGDFVAGAGFSFLGDWYQPISKR